METKYRKIKFEPGETLESAVDTLLKHKENNELVYGVFSGVDLHSDTVSLDNAYVKVTGNSLARFQELLKTKQDEFAKKQEEHEFKIPQLIEYWKARGREVLSGDKIELWDKTVPVRLNDIYRGMELKQCLDIVLILQTGSFDDAKLELEKQNHSGTSYSLVCWMVKSFSEQGKEFVEYLSR